MVKKRRLADLYVRGKTIEFDDGAGDPVSVYLKKLNSFETEKTLRSANAARAKYLAARKNVESPEYVETFWKNADTTSSPEKMIELLVDHKMVPIQASIEAEIGAEDEWSERGYLQGLMDAWETLKSKDLDEDAEAKHVLDELTRYHDQVKEQVDQRRRALVQDYQNLDPERLRQEALDLLFEREADIVWLTEFRLAEIWQATRVSEEDPRSLYFDSREELAELDQVVLRRLIDTYRELTVDVTEGKASPATPDSSDLSGSPEPEVASEPSGPVTVPA